MKKNIIATVFLLSFMALFYSCLDKKEPTEITTHPNGWADSSSASFHGKMVLESIADAQNCQSCHGSDYRGGNAEKSCFASGCHQIYPHPQEFADSLSVDFHANYIAEVAEWDILTCRKCHGQDYSGIGSDKKNCLVCHTQPEGPEACNTCHGNAENFAPPRDLSDNTATTAIGVGAHQQHLSDTTLTTAFERGCFLCHNEPEKYSDAGHTDNAPPPADIQFNLTASDTGNSVPLWNHDTATCSDVYCHGSFVFYRDSSATNFWGYSDSVMTGNHPDMQWTSVGTGQTACGTCHDLPPQGHIAAVTCEGCHPRVVDADFNIVNKKLHINGKADLF